MVSQAFLISGAPVFCMLLCFFFRKATRKQVLVNRCSRTHVSSISSLVERILAGTEHTSFFLCLAAPRWFIGKEEKGRGMFLLYSFTWLFYERLYFSPPPFLEVSFVGAEICVCSVVPKPWVIAFLVVCHYRDFCSQCVGVQKKKNLKTCIHHVVAGAHVGRFCLWV